jgi:hypothetical protein
MPPQTPPKEGLSHPHKAGLFEEFFIIRNLCITKGVKNELPTVSILNGVDMNCPGFNSQWG